MRVTTTTTTAWALGVFLGITSIVAFQTTPSFAPRRHRHASTTTTTTTTTTTSTRRRCRQQSCTSPLVCHASAITAGDTVLVIGGTGGVGQLVTKKLLQRGDVAVRVTSRDVARGQATIDDEQVKVVPLDLTGDANIQTQQLQVALEGVAAVVISVGTTAFPTAKWAGGNTPQAIDKVAVAKIAEAASKVAGLKKVVLITSIGIDRTGDMPFKILNLFGVLDAKRSGEEAIQAAAKQKGFDYVLVRPGRLVGGPWTNYDVANLLKLEGGAENGVQVELGDSLLGDCKRDACAEAIVQSLLNPECSNLAFSVITTDQPALTSQQWKSEFQRLNQLAPAR